MYVGSFGDWSKGESKSLSLSSHHAKWQFISLFVAILWSLKSNWLDVEIVCFFRSCCCCCCIKLLLCKLKICGFWYDNVAHIEKLKYINTVNRDEIHFGKYKAAQPNGKPIICQLIHCFWNVKHKTTKKCAASVHQDKRQA